MFKKILVPTDGSALSQEAVSRAISFASEAGAHITFFCAEKRFPLMYFGADAIFDSHTPTRFHEEVDSVAHGIVDAAEQLAQAAGVPCNKLVLESEEPYEGIIAAAERNDCDLIFMASHGHKGFGALFLGSETHKVLTHTKIPVLVHRKA